jgi:hypothetical protein
MQFLLDLDGKNVRDNVDDGGVCSKLDSYQPFQLAKQAIGLVEAPGVEPGSENDGSKEPTYLVAFTLPAFAGNLRSARSERTRNASC